METNIVVLDGYVANSGDLSWDALARLGKLTVYERTAPDEIAERCTDAEIVITNKVVLNADTIAGLPRLRYVGVLATGYNNVDIAACSERGITVCNIPAYSTESVVQTALSLLLELTNNTGGYSQSVRRLQLPPRSHNRTQWQDCRHLRAGQYRHANGRGFTCPGHENHSFHNQKRRQAAPMG